MSTGFSIIIRDRCGEIHRRAERKIRGKHIKLPIKRLFHPAVSFKFARIAFQPAAAGELSPEEETSAADVVEAIEEHSEPENGKDISSDVSEEAVAFTEDISESEMNAEEELEFTENIPYSRRAERIRRRNYHTFARTLEISGELS